MLTPASASRPQNPAGAGRRGSLGACKRPHPPASPTAPQHPPSCPDLAAHPRWGFWSRTQAPLCHLEIRGQVQELVGGGVFLAFPKLILGRGWGRDPSPPRQPNLGGSSTWGSPHVLLDGQREAPSRRCTSPAALRFPRDRPRGEPAQPPSASQGPRSSVGVRWSRSEPCWGEHGGALTACAAG